MGDEGGIENKLSLPNLSLNSSQMNHQPVSGAGLIFVM